MAPTAGDERDWEDAFRDLLAGLNEDTAICRHGDHAIHKTPRGTWEDDQGMEGCIKGELKTPDHPGQPGGAIAREVIPHEPRPVIA